MLLNDGAEKKEKYNNHLEQEGAYKSKGLRFYYCVGRIGSLLMDDKARRT